MTSVIFMAESLRAGDRGQGSGVSERDAVVWFASVRLVSKRVGAVGLEILNVKRDRIKKGVSMASHRVIVPAPVVRILRRRW